MSLPGRPLRPAQRAGPAAGPGRGPPRARQRRHKGHQPPQEGLRLTGEGRGPLRVPTARDATGASALPFSRGPQPAARTIRRTSAPSRPLPAPHGGSRNAPGAPRPPTAPRRGQLPLLPSPRAAAPRLTPTAANQDGGERENGRAAFRDMGREGPLPGASTA